MYRLKGMANIDIVYRTAIAFSGGKSLTSYIEQNKKQAGGAKAVVGEIKTIKGLKK
jgi:hypothetical protein